MSRDDGGPAFPSAMACSPMGDVHDSFNGGLGGMSLHDYFAAKVLPGVWASFTDNGRFVEDGMLERVAQECRRMADAMLAERSKP